MAQAQPVPAFDRRMTGNQHSQISFLIRFLSSFLSLLFTPPLPIRLSRPTATKEDFEKISFPKLTEITDFLLVFQVDGLFSLGRLFPNLTVIRGQKLFTDRYALYASDATHMEEIDLHNLALIERGQVMFENNPQLCYATSIDWNYLTKGRSGNEFQVSLCLKIAFFHLAAFWSTPLPVCASKYPSESTHLKN